MKLEGYLITAETFKLKTIFKHPRKHHHVIFYARDSDDRDNEVLLNNNNAIAVTPGGCDMPFRSVVMSHHGQIGNKGNKRRIFLMREEVLLVKLNDLVASRKIKLKIEIFRRDNLNKFSTSVG